MSPLPMGWCTRPIGDLVDVLDGRRIPVSARERANRAGEVPYYGAAGQVGWINDALFDEELVLLGEDGVQFFDPNRPKAYRITGRAWVNNHAHVLRPRSGQIDGRYLTYYLNQIDYKGLANGTTRLKLTQAAMRRIVVSAPPIVEQRRIVDILEDHLSRLDAAAASLMTSRRHLVAYQRASLDGLTEDAAMRHIALGDALAAVEAGRSFGGAARPSFDDEWGIVKVSAMTWGEFRPAENKLVSDQSKVDPRYQIHAGDLLMSRANTSEYVGAPVLVRAEPARLLLSDKSLRLVPRDGVSAEYLWRVLSAPRTRAQISDRASGNQDSMRNISQATLKSIVIPWTDQQHGVIGAANDLDDQVARMSAVIDRSRTRGTALRRALLHAAFSGQLTGRSSDLERAAESIA